MAKTLLIMGSVRAGRRCPQIAAWVLGIARAASDADYELVDLADWPLGMDSEPGIPAFGKGYARELTCAWSEKIKPASAIIFVTPQYNWGYPAVLKNAIDHLFHEWKGKPALIITYGGHGGGKCAAQLRQVVEQVGMTPLATMPALTLPRAAVEGAPHDPAKDFTEEEVDMIKQAIIELPSARNC
jgi:NAD(P)H-dependent FMN reductase